MRFSDLLLFSSALPLTACGTGLDTICRPPVPARIAFASNADPTGSGGFVASTNLWIMNPDGTNRRALTKGGANAISVFEPLFTPDGTRIVFRSNLDLSKNDQHAPVTSKNLWIINVDGSGLRPLTNLSSANVINSPTSDFIAGVTPDGNSVIYYSDAALNGGDSSQTTFNIWKVGIDGSPPVPLTSSGSASIGGNSTPALSPDGSLIAFASTASLSTPDVGTADLQNIWIMHTDGTKRTPLTHTAAGGSVFSNTPSFSPDGTHLLFLSRVDANLTWQGALDPLNIWTVDPGGQHYVRVTVSGDASMNYVFPFFGPDSATIYAISNGNLAAPLTSNGIVYNVFRMSAAASNTPVALTRYSTPNVAMGASIAGLSGDGGSLIFIDKADPSGADAGVGTYNIWTLDTGTSQLKALTKDSSGVASYARGPKAWFVPPAPCLN